jgi:hypothetical protein
MAEQWWWAVDTEGHVMRKSTNRVYLSEVARLKGWTVKKAPKEKTGGE